MRKKILVGITYGDPASIGPEILLKTLQNWNFEFKPVVIGLKRCLTNDPRKIKRLSNFSFQFTSLRQFKNHKYILGKPSKYTGMHAYQCLREAVNLLCAKGKEKIRALVTGPVSKSAVNLTYANFSGQTDEIARFCKVDPENVIMLFVANDFRVALFTRHIPLRLVSTKISKIKLKQYVLLLNNELRKWFCISKPEIAVLGLNPHASEDGLFGDEEKKIIKPVIDNLASCRFKVFGPLSGDATLAKAAQDYLSGKKQKYDVYVSFYHDQSLPAFKAVCGMKGVNVTLGLPFLRVSVAHGTAFDIASKKTATNEGLISAIKLVESLIPN